MDVAANSTLAVTYTNNAPAKVAAKRFSQDEWEFAQLTRHVPLLGSVLEIGSRYGESLRRLAHASCATRDKKTRIVAVDLGKDPFSPAEEDILTPLMGVVDMLQLTGFDARVVLGNSHDPKIIEIVRDLGPFDFCFIDGDHSYDGVYQDWNNYGPMCKVVAFHDICYGKPGHDGAKTLWTQIKHSYCHAEYVRSGLGIGVIFREEAMR